MGKKKKDQSRIVLGESGFPLMHEMFVPKGQFVNQGVGAMLPATFGVTAGFIAFNCKRCIQQQHTLLRPSVEATVSGRSKTKAGVDFLEDIFQRWRRPNRRRH